MPKRKAHPSPSEDDSDHPESNKRIKGEEHGEAKIRKLEEENAALKAKVIDYQNRLSQMASQRMREGNPCVEDLSDPYRPTALADKWNGLFKTGEYWTAYANVSTVLKSDEGPAQFLYNSTRTVWKACVDFVEDFMPQIVVQWSQCTGLPRLEDKEKLQQQAQKKLPGLREKLEEILPQNASRVYAIMKKMEEEYDNVNQTDIPKLQQKLRKAVCQLLKVAEPPELLTKKVMDAIEKDKAIDKSVQKEEDFVCKLANLCYFMRLQEVPLWVNFDFAPGSAFDPSMFEVDSSSSQPSKGLRIKSVIRPPLLRSEGGAVLSKGEVDVEPAKRR